LLVPNAAAGALIGNSGSTIRELMQRFQAEIRLSRHGDYFPGTSERVCVVSGDVDNVCNVTEFVFHATKKEAENNKSSGIDEKRYSQLQMVVSHIAAGMIVVVVCLTFAHGWGFHIALNTGMQLRIITTGAIYHKVTI